MKAGRQEMPPRKETDRMTVQDEMGIFCANVKRLRVRDNLTLREMADRLHISLKTLTRLERGEIPPRLSVAVVCRISREFGVHPKELFTSAEKQNKQPK